MIVVEKFKMKYYLSPLLKGGVRGGYLNINLSLNPSPKRDFLGAFTINWQISVKYRYFMLLPPPKLATRKT
jgi:hypothetical protein